jgi:hypothetical protein
MIFESLVPRKSISIATAWASGFFASKEQGNGGVQVMDSERSSLDRQKSKKAKIELCVIRQVFEFKTLRLDKPCGPYPAPQV